MNKANQVAFPTTTASGFGAGRSSAPLSDWKPQRLKPMPDEALVRLADSASSRVVAALGAHPAIMGGASGSGAISLTAQRQFRTMLMQPMARLIEENTWRVFGERIRIWWPAGVEGMLVKSRAAAMLAQLGVDPQEALQLARLTRGNVKMAPTPEPPPPQEGDE